MRLTLLLSAFLLALTIPSTASAFFTFDFQTPPITGLGGGNREPLPATPIPTVRFGSTAGYSQPGESHLATFGSVNVGNRFGRYGFVATYTRQQSERLRWGIDAATIGTFDESRPERSGVFPIGGGGRGFASWELGEVERPSSLNPTFASHILAGVGNYIVASDLPATSGAVAVATLDLSYIIAGDFTVGSLSVGVLNSLSIPLSQPDAAPEDGGEPSYSYTEYPVSLFHGIGVGFDWQIAPSFGLHFETATLVDLGYAGGSASIMARGLVGFDATF